MAKLRKSLIKNALEMTGKVPTDEDIEFLAKETKSDVEFVKNAISELQK